MDDSTFELLTDVPSAPKFESLAGVYVDLATARECLASQGSCGAGEEFGPVNLDSVYRLEQQRQEYREKSSRLSALKVTLRATTLSLDTLPAYLALVKSIEALEAELDSYPPSARD